MDNLIFENLRTIRKKQGKSLEEVGKAVDIAPSSLSRIENAKSPNVSFKTIFYLANYYGISLDELIEKNFEKNKNLNINNSDKITVSKKELPYYRVVREAKKEGLSSEETKTIIGLFKKISAAAQVNNSQDEFSKLALKAKANGISKERFQNMIEFLISNEEFKKINKGGKYND